MAIEFQNDPYFDDYDVAGSDGLTPREKYYRVLFRPAVAVQARELTQLQSILQDQVSRFGDHMFKEGSMVIPGGTSLDLEYAYVKVNDLSGAAADVSVYYQEFEGTTITGQTSGVQAEVLDAIPADTDSGDPITLFVKYIDSGTDNTSKVFTNGEELVSDAPTPRYATVNETGNGSAFSVNDGIYYVNGIFVDVRAQTLILDKYSAEPSYIIGFNVVETLVTSTEDANLNDNANGAPNYAAPGAHRYRIDLTLTKKDLTTTDTEGFVQLAKVENGIVRQKVEKTDYSLLEDTLARRTYDESGNYTVRPFGIEVREHLKDGDNRGIYDAPDGDEAKLAMGLEKGKAYVRGYEIETLSTTYVDMNKARDYESDTNVAIPFRLGNYALVTNLTGLPNVNIFPEVSLRDATVVTDGSPAGTEIGVARVRVVEHDSGTIGSGSEQYKVFLFDIQMNSGQSFDSVRSIYVAGTPPTTADLILESGSAVIKDPTANASLVPMPYNVIKTIRDGSNVLTNYEVRRVFNRTLSSGTDTISLTSGNEQFVSPYDTAENFLLTVNDSINGWVQVDLSSNSRITGSSSQVDIDLTDLGYTNESFMLIGTVFKQQAQEKGKSLVSDYNLDISSPNSTPGGYDTLGKADVFQISGIYMSSAAGTPATTSDQDVTDRYVLDNGQRDSFYDLGRIRLKNSASAPTGDLLVVFDYFTHTDGDYFSVDSYAGIDYDQIPTYQSRGQNFALRDVMDFRPRVRDGDGDGFVNGGVGFQNASVVEMVKVGDSIVTTFEYYLGRIDKIFIDAKGDFGVIEGVSSLNPAPPKNPDDAMVLYQVELAPYTFGPSDVIPSIVDNRRYTMRDIGKLESRIKNLEYYTSLSLLEKETADLQIPDASNVDRFKNGFVVDPFYGHNIGNPGLNDYHISVDAESGIARPQYYSDAVRLEYNTGSSSGMVKKGDVLMLDYRHVEYASQPYASRTENVTPYLVFKFVGDIQLSPDTDDWKDTERRPELIVDNQGLFDVVNLLQDQTDVFGTVWNEWQTQWSGRSLQTQSRTSGWVTTTDTIETIQSTQARAGIRTSVAPDTIQTSLGDRVVDIRMVPFVRSRRVKFKGSRLKPNTRVYPFFDNINVADFCKPETFTLFSDNPVDAEPNDEAVRHPDLTSTDIANGTNKLVTDANGEIEGEFYIPNTDTLRFRTGDRVFRLSDDDEDREGFITTAAAATYSARGLLSTEQEVSLREPHIAQQQVSQTREVTSSRLINRIIRDNTPDSGGSDPLAQTFLVDEAGGVIITKVDVFFKAVDESIPVKMEIRTVDNGYPTNTIVPLAEKSLVLSTVANASEDASVATTFEFDTPVYLNQGREYAIVLKSASNAFRVYTSKLGENEIGTTNRISKQPTLGSLFKSQNGTTWSASQLEDLKYTMYRASFDDTSGNLNTGSVVLNNADIPAKKLLNPIYTTAGSNRIYVNHKNHGMPEGATVTISGVDADFNGVTAAALNTDHVLIHVEQDWYGFDIGSNASATGNSGGENVYATEDKTINILMPNVNYVRLPDTGISWSTKMTTGRSLAGTESTYDLDSDYSSILPNENYITPAPRLIASPINESTNVPAGAKSFWLKGDITTNSNNVSPMIDLVRSSAICVMNRIDNPQAIGGGISGRNEVLNFVDETTATDCSALARYITKKISLKDPSTALKILFSGNRPNGSSIDVYYKTQAAGDDQPFDALPWIEATPESTPLTTEDTTKFEDYEYLDDSLSAFTYFAVKVVLRSQNSSKVPMIKDFRSIALAV